jgi:hypothetical protein
MNVDAAPARFVATHDVTAHDLTHAMRLTRRPTDLVGGLLAVVVLSAILWQVLYAFSIYVRAAAGFPERLMALLRFQSGAGDAVLAWLSVVVTLSLPVFLFYSVRALAETLRPDWRVRRLMRDSSMYGPTTYTIDGEGVRSTRMDGADMFMPWSTFDGLRSDAEIAVLLRGTRLLFFVPLRAFGADHDVVRAHLRSSIAASR